MSAGIKTEEKKSTTLRYPRNYKVIVHNDNYTPADFVVILLVEVFNKSLKDAKDTMLSVHHDGAGVAGIYSYEVAEQKTQESIALARHNGHPLKVTYEEA